MINTFLKVRSPVRSSTRFPMRSQIRSSMLFHMHALPVRAPLVARSQINYT